MEGRINLPAGTPRKGWVYVDCEDIGKAEHHCEACGYSEVRYVHQLEHPNVIEPLYVGCVCAGHLTQDYVTPKENERRAKGFDARVAKFLTRPWQVSDRGTKWMNYRGHLLWIFQRKNGSYGYAIDKQFSITYFGSEIAAARALYKQLFGSVRS